MVGSDRGVSSASPQALIPCKAPSSALHPLLGGVLRALVPLLPLCLVEDMMLGSGQQVWRIRVGVSIKISTSPLRQVQHLLIFGEEP